MQPVAKTILTGRTIWLLGACSDIGKALTHQLVENGNVVIISGVSEVVLKRLIHGNDFQVKLLPIDVACTDSLAQARFRLSQLTQYLDAVIYCTDERETQTVNPTNFKQIMEQNFFGLVRILQLAKPLLHRSQTTPQLAVINSLISGIPALHSQAYGAANAALDYFIQSMRADRSLLPLHITSIKLDYSAAQLKGAEDVYTVFVMTKRLMAEKIIKAINSKKDVYEIPSGIYLFLRMLGFFRYAWLKWFMCKIIRAQGW